MSSGFDSPHPRCIFFFMIIPSFPFSSFPGIASFVQRLQLLLIALSLSVSLSVDLSLFRLDLCKGIAPACSYLGRIARSSIYM